MTARGDHGFRKQIGKRRDLRRVSRDCFSHIYADRGHFHPGHVPDARCPWRCLLRAADPVCFDQLGEKVASFPEVPHPVRIDSGGCFGDFGRGFGGAHDGWLGRCVFSRAGHLPGGHSCSTSVQRVGHGRTAKAQNTGGKTVARFWLLGRVGGSLVTIVWSICIAEGFRGLPLRVGVRDSRRCPRISSCFYSKSWSAGSSSSYKG